MTRHKTAVQPAALAWCRQGHTSNAVLDVLLEAMRHRPVFVTARHGGGKA